MPARKSSSKAAVVADDTFEMADIVDYKCVGRKELWRVRWKGYAPSDDTWEPKDNILQPGPNLAAKMEQCKRAYLDKAKAPTPAPTPAPAPSATRAAKRKSSRPPSETPTVHKEARVSRASSGRMAAASPPKTVVSVPHVTHIGRPRNGRDTSVDNYEVTLTYQPSGMKETRLVGEVRGTHPNELLEYLLSRVRFRDSKDTP